MSEQGSIRIGIRPQLAKRQRRNAENLIAKGAIAQLGEHLLCKQGVGGSIPPGSTIFRSSALGRCSFVTTNFTTPRLDLQKMAEDFWTA